MTYNYKNPKTFKKESEKLQKEREQIQKRLDVLHANFQQETEGGTIWNSAARHKQKTANLANYRDQKLVLLQCDKGKKRNTIKNKCGQCERNIASLICRECSEKFCTGCFKTFHKKGAMKTHIPTTYNTNNFERLINENNRTNSINDTNSKYEKQVSTSKQDTINCDVTSSFGNLLDGNYDEEESSKQFQLAVNNWRHNKENRDINSYRQSSFDTKEMSTSTERNVVEQKKMFEKQIKFSSTSTLSYAEKLFLKKATKLRTESARIEKENSINGKIVRNVSTALPVQHLLEEAAVKEIQTIMNISEQHLEEIKLLKEQVVECENERLESARSATKIHEIDERLSRPATARIESARSVSAKPVKSGRKNDDHLQSITNRLCTLDEPILEKYLSFETFRLNEIEEDKKPKHQVTSTKIIDEVKLGRDSETKLRTKITQQSSWHPEKSVETTLISPSKIVDELTELNSPLKSILDNSMNKKYGVCDEEAEEIMEYDSLSDRTITNPNDDKNELTSSACSVVDLNEDGLLEVRKSSIGIIQDSLQLNDKEPVDEQIMDTITCSSRNLLKLKKYNRKISEQIAETDEYEFADEKLDDVVRAVRQMSLRSHRHKNKIRSADLNKRNQLSAISNKSLPLSHRDNLKTRKLISSSPRKSAHSTRTKSPTKNSMDLPKNFLITNSLRNSRINSPILDKSRETEKRNLKKPKKKQSHPQRAISAMSDEMSIYDEDNGLNGDEEDSMSFQSLMDQYHDKSKD
ncbi:hypothetical protein SNEBB_009893 [Seison nebaliae]|nr:hypothetical protein SNEBB_009893 [Seison nebaliae]